MDFQIMSFHILPSQDLTKAIAQNFIQGDPPIKDEYIQPASIDLRLGAIAYRVSASFLSGNKKGSVLDKINRLKMHEVNLETGGVLEKGCIYIIPLVEKLSLPSYLMGRANPKSSTGRLDIFSRLLTDGSSSFDNITAGFEGELYVEISPRTFSIKVRMYDRLNQLRLHHIDQDNNPLPAPNNLPFTIDVEGKKTPRHTDFPPIIGWRARKHAGLIDLSLINHYDILDFWEPVFARKQGGIILDPDDFYIFATKENISIPHDMAAEMQAYDISFGEFRVHYAGFFDPGFGVNQPDSQTKGVLEVRTHEVPFLIDPDQIVGHLSFEKMKALPDKVYGANMGSHYQGQGLKLSKQFAKNDFK